MAVAIYWDFENVHAALIGQEHGPKFYRDNYFKPQQVVLQADKIMDYVATLGDVFINRAYANWQWLSRYSNDLLAYSIDLIQLFPRGRYSKNGADIRLALDVMEDCLRFSHIEQVVIISGDSDFISVAQKVQQLGKTVLGVGVEDATNDFWIKSCNEFKYYGTLVAKFEKEHEASAGAVERDPEEAQALFLRALKMLTVDRNEKWVKKAQVRPTMKRLDPSFDEASYGYPSFTELLRACRDKIQISRDQDDHRLSLRVAACRAGAEGTAPVEAAPAQPLADTLSSAYESLLKKQGIFLGDSIWRFTALCMLRQLLQPAALDNSILTWPHLDESLARKLAENNQPAELADARKFRNLVVKSRIIRLGSQGMALTADMTPEAMEKAIVRLVIARILGNVHEPINLEALHHLLYGTAAAPATDIAALVAEVRHELEPVNGNGNGNGHGANGTNGVHHE